MLSWCESIKSLILKLLQLNKYIKYKVLEMKSKMTKLLKVFPLLLTQHDSSTCIELYTFWLPLTIHLIVDKFANDFNDLLILFGQLVFPRAHNDVFKFPLLSNQ